jgi:hypothetical protein
MTRETRITTNEDRDVIQEGYFLTEDKLLELLRDYIVDSRAGLVSSSEIYLEDWLKNN